MLVRAQLLIPLEPKKFAMLPPYLAKLKYGNITLFRRIFLIDCPGVVYPTGDSETDIVLKGVVRIEQLEDPDIYIDAVLERVKKEYIVNTYEIEEWDNTEDFLEKLAL